MLMRELITKFYFWINYQIFNFQNINLSEKFINEFYRGSLWFIKTN